MRKQRMEESKRTADVLGMVDTIEEFGLVAFVIILIIKYKNDKKDNGMRGVNDGECNKPGSYYEGVYRRNQEKL